MNEVMAKAIERLYAFFDNQSDSLFNDDEHKSRVIEGCEVLLNRRVSVADAQTVVNLLNYPEDTADFYAEFIQANSKPATDDYAELRNAVAELLKKTAQESDDFIINEK
jgi:hypothetical protein